MRKRPSYQYCRINGVKHWLGRQLHIYLIYGLNFLSGAASSIRAAVAPRTFDRKTIMIYFSHGVHQSLSKKQSNRTSSFRFIDFCSATIFERSANLSVTLDANAFLVRVVHPIYAVSLLFLRPIVVSPHDHLVMEISQGHRSCPLSKCDSHTPYSRSLGPVQVACLH